MDSLQSLIDSALVKLASLKLAVIDFLRSIPILDRFSDSVLEWVLIAAIFIIAIIVIIPVIKWSVKISMAAAIIAGIAAFFTSMSFWVLLPFTGLGVAIVSFSNKFGGD